MKLLILFTFNIAQLFTKRLYPGRLFSTSCCQLDSVLLVVDLDVAVDLSKL